jgi:phosphatidylglycerophosphate synthase
MVQHCPANSMVAGSSVVNEARLPPLPEGSGLMTVQGDNQLDAGAPDLARPSPSLRLDACRVTVAIGALLLAALYLFETWRPGVISGHAAFVVYAAISGLALFNLGAHGHDRFGAANIVTTLRAAMTAMIGAAMPVFGQSAPILDDSCLWAIAAMAVSALALDGIDGHLARRTGTESAFGARFDMEVDALLILILSLFAVLLGKAGIWLLAIGLMRYIFVAAQLFVPALRGALPQSMRRKSVCVIQAGALCLMLLPVIAPPLSVAISAVALALLAYSFLVDVVFLLKADKGRYGPA